MTNVSNHASVAPRANLYAGREGLAVLWLAGSLGILARVLLHDSESGLGAAVWALAFVVSLIGLATDWSWRIQRDRLWIAMPLLMLPFTYVWRSSATLAFGTTSAILTLSTVWVGTFLLDQHQSIRFVPVFARLARLFPSFVHDQLDFKRTGILDHRETWQSIARGLVFSAPVLLVFVALLASADARFEGLLASPLNAKFAEGVASTVYVCFVGAIVGIFLLGCIRVLRGSETVRPRPTRLTVNLVEAHVILGLVSMLFVAFVAVQLSGQATAGLTGAELSANARRGFFQLVGVAAISLLLATSLQTRLNQRDGILYTNFRRSVAANAVLVLAILASAALRMFAYTSALGWTVLRLNTSFAMAWTAVLFVALIAMNLTSVAVNLPKVGVATALVLLLGMYSMNPDAFIAGHNIDRGHLQPSDAYYVAALSRDAGPAIAERWGELSPDSQRLIREYWQASYNQDPRDWRALTVGDLRQRQNVYTVWNPNQ